MPPSRSLSQAHVVAVATTLVCLVMGIDALVSEDVDYRWIGTKLLGIVAIAAVAAWRSRGEAGPMLRWLGVLSLLQAVLLGWIILTPAATRGADWLAMALPLGGWLVAMARVGAAMGAEGTTPPD